MKKKRKSAVSQKPYDPFQSLSIEEKEKICLYMTLKGCIIPFPFNHRFYYIDAWGRLMNTDLFRSTGMEHMQTFNKLTPYDVDFMCEKIYVAMEKFVDSRKGRSSRSELPFSLADYKHLHLKGMRDYFFDMISAQKMSFDHYLDAMRASSYMEKELTPEEIENHRRMFAQSHEAEQKKDPATESGQGLKVSMGGKR